MPLFGPVHVSWVIGAMINLAKGCSKVKKVNPEFQGDFLSETLRLLEVERTRIRQIDVFGEVVEVGWLADLN